MGYGPAGLAGPGGLLPVKENVHTQFFIVSRRDTTKNRIELLHWIKTVAKHLWEKQHQATTISCPARRSDVTTTPLSRIVLGYLTRIVQYPGEKKDSRIKN